MASKTDPTPEELAHRRAAYLTGLLWHLGSFLIINVSFWLLDANIGQDGLQWAPWITAFWGFALAFHALAWLIDGRQVEERRTRHYMDRHGGAVH